MGYNTDCTRSVRVEPPLSVAEAEFLQKFSEADHRDEPDVPGYFCQWVPAEPALNGFGFTAIEWDGGEKFYDSVEWM
jgi:hypothetical protein